VPAKTKAVSTPVKQAPSKRGKVNRKNSDLSASDGEDGGKKCRECLHERDGFKCKADQIHIACHTCGKLMANRDDVSFHQYCVLCTTNYCNLYYPPCSRSGVKL
jgi:hypothetical protein